MLDGEGRRRLVRMVEAADALDRLLPGVDGVVGAFGDGGMMAMSGFDDVGAGGRRSRRVELSGCRRAWNKESEESEADVEVDGKDVSLAVIPMAKSMGEQSSSSHAG